MLSPIHKASQKPAPKKRSDPMLPFPDAGIPVPAPLSTSGNVVRALPMTLKEAYGVLCVNHGASWESVETARRGIVAQSHPDRLRICDLTKQREVKEKARRANLAAQVLFASRVSPEVSLACPTQLELAEAAEGSHSQVRGAPPKKSPASVQFNDQAPVDRRVVRS